MLRQFWKARVLFYLLREALCSNGWGIAILLQIKQASATHGYILSLVRVHRVRKTLEIHRFFQRWNINLEYQTGSDYLRRPRGDVEAVCTP